MVNKDDYKPGVVERLSVHPAMAVATTGAAVGFAATAPVAVFLPVLAGSLAGIRHGQRLERFIADVSSDLNDLHEKLDSLADAQYQLISESLVSALNTLDKRKLEYLRFAITNVLEIEIDPSQSAFVARAVRDISAEEAEFLLRISTRSGIAFFDVKNPAMNIQKVDPASSDGDAVEGLLSLGLLRSSSGYGGTTMKLTRNAGVVCRLLRNP